MEVVKLLVEAGASTEAKSAEGKTPIVLAVSSEHVDVYHYLINKKHDSYKLLEDKKVGGWMDTTLLITTSSFLPSVQARLYSFDFSNYNLLPSLSNYLHYIIIQFSYIIFYFTAFIIQPLSYYLYYTAHFLPKLLRSS